MEFVISRVYTAVNAEDLEIGSTCIFANSLYDLQKQVEDGSGVDKLMRVLSSNSIARFEGKGGCLRALAYFVAPPSEPKYRPFSSVDEAVEALKKHGWWVTDAKARMTLFIQAYEDSNKCKQFLLGHSWVTLDDLFEIFIFTDDGTPCGVLCQ